MSRRRHHHHGALFICAMCVLGPAYGVLWVIVWVSWHMLRAMSFLVFGRPRLVPLGGLRRVLTSWLDL